MARWSQVLPAIEESKLLSGLSLQIAKEAKFSRVEGNTFYLIVHNDRASFLKRDLLGKNRHIEAIEDALKKHFMRDLSVKFDIIDSSEPSHYESEQKHAEGLFKESFPHIKVVSINRIFEQGETC